MVGRLRQLTRLVCNHQLDLSQQQSLVKQGMDGMSSSTTRVMCITCGTTKCTQESIVTSAMELLVMDHGHLNCRETTFHRNGPAPFSMKPKLVHSKWRRATSRRHGSTLLIKKSGYLRFINFRRRPALKQKLDSLVSQYLMSRQSISSVEVLAIRHLFRVA